MSVQHTLDELMNLLRQVIILSDFNYKIWRTLRPEVYTEELRNADDAYGHFFHMSAHSHFSEAIILTHQIFHRPGGHLYDDTMSFERILDLILCQASLMPEALIAIADEWSNARATHGKIKLLRNKWMAHRDLSYTETAVFVEADLTPFQLAEQIERGKRLHNILGDVLNTGEYRFDLDPSEAHFITSSRAASLAGHAGCSS